MKAGFAMHAEVVQAPKSPLKLDRQYARHGLPECVHVPETTVYDHLAVSARRFPGKNAIYFYGAAMRYSDQLEPVKRKAGYQQHAGGV